MFLESFLNVFRILLLDAGKIAEFDAPSELLRRKGTFYSMAEDAGLAWVDHVFGYCNEKLCSVDAQDQFVHCRQFHWAVIRVSWCWKFECTQAAGLSADSTAIVPLSIEARTGEELLLFEFLTLIISST